MAKKLQKDVDVNVSNKIFMAISQDIPVVGKQYHCYKMEVKKGQPKFTGVNTSFVTESIYLGNNIYRVVTLNSEYIVNVG